MNSAASPPPETKRSLGDDFGLGGGAHNSDDRLSMIENQLTGLDAISLDSNNTIGHHTLLRHELNQKELDVYMLNTRLTWHEKILDERSQMLERKTNEIEELKKKIQTQTNRVHALETQQHEAKTNIQTLQNQKAHLKTSNEDLKVRNKEDRETIRKLQRKVDELEDTNRSSFMNRSLTQNQDSLKDLERNITSEMKSALARIKDSLDLQNQNILSEVRINNQGKLREDQYEKENAKLNAQLKEHVQTIQKLKWKLETYTDKYNKIKEENARIQSIHDSALTEILKNQTNLLRTIQNHSEQINGSVATVQKSEESLPAHSLVLAIEKIERRCEKLQNSIVQKSDFGHLERGIEGVQSTIGITPQLLKEILEKLGTVANDVNSNISRTENILTERVQNVVNTIPQNFSQQSRDILVKLDSMSSPKPMHTSADYLDSKITSEMQRLNQTVEKSLKHSVDTLYSTLKGSFDVLAKNIREMACGESSLAGRQMAGEIDDNMSRIVSSINEILSHVRKPHNIIQTEGKITAEMLQEITSMVNSKEITSNQEVLLSQIRELREQLNSHSKATEAGLSYAYSQVPSKSDLVAIQDKLTGCLSKDHAAALQLNATQTLQKYIERSQTELKSHLDITLSTQSQQPLGNVFDPLRRGSIELPGAAGSEHNSFSDDKVLTKLEAIESQLRGNFDKVLRSFAVNSESIRADRNSNESELINFIDAKMDNLKHLLEDRRSSRDPLTERVENGEGDRTAKSKLAEDISFGSDGKNLEEIVAGKRESIDHVMREFRFVMNQMNTYVSRGQHDIPELQKMIQVANVGISEIQQTLTASNRDDSLNTLNEVRNLQSKFESYIAPIYNFFIQASTPVTFEGALLQWSQHLLNAYRNSFPNIELKESQLHTLQKSITDNLAQKPQNDDLKGFHTDVKSLRSDLSSVQNLQLPLLSQSLLVRLNELREVLNQASQKFAVQIVVFLICMFFLTPIYFSYVSLYPYRSVS